MAERSPGEALAAFAASLDVAAIPAAVLDRAADLMVDWLGSALAGKGARPVETIGERLTSVEAEARMRELGVRPEERKRRVDEVAASIILEEYLSTRGAERRSIDG